MEKTDMDLFNDGSFTPDFVPKGSSALKSVRGDNLKLIQDDDFDSIFNTDNSLSDVEIDDEYATILFPENALDDIERFLTTVDDTIILIDDASPDRCGEICDAYAAKDTRFRVVHHPTNKGVSAVRNQGIRLASCDYIMFVDSDDWVADDLCKEAYQCTMWVVR